MRQEVGEAGSVLLKLDAEGYAISSGSACAAASLDPSHVLSAMDLRALTGGTEQPALVLDPLVVGGVLGGVALLTVLAVLVFTGVSRRADLATELRMGEET